MPTGRSPVDFIVIGAQRAGSTHLNLCLRDHPEIFLCPDEVPYFERPFFDASHPSALEAALRRAKVGQRRGIQRPDYLGRPECPANIRSMAPQVRLLAVLRDPVSRALSAYHWYVQFGLLPLLPLAEGMSRLLAGWTDPRHPRAPEILEFGFYGRHLARYLDTFDASQLLVLLVDDFGDAATFERIYRFLGVDDRDRPVVDRSPTNAGTYDPRRLRVLRARRRLAWSWDDAEEYTYRPRRLRRPLASLVSAGVVGIDRVVLSRVLPPVPPPTLPPDLERELRALYRTDVELLERLLGRDLQGWRRPRPSAA